MQFCPEFETFHHTNNHTNNPRSIPVINLIAHKINLLQERDFEDAIKILKNFEKKDSNVKSQAANNLAFIYFLQQKYAESSTYASKALQADKYNPAALVNKGNCVALRSVS